MLFMDLGGFKHVDNSLGHAAGDELLMEMAVGLRICLRHGETRARFGGDGFVGLLKDASGKAGAAEVAGQIARGSRPRST